MQRLLDFLPALIGFAFAFLVTRYGRPKQGPPALPPPSPPQAPVTEITQGDLERHQTSVRPTELLQRLKAESPKPIRAEGRPYDEDVEAVNRTELARLEAELPIGVPHVTIDSGTETRRTFYRTGTSWLMMREALTPGGTDGPPRWTFQFLEIRDTRPIQVKMPLEAGSIPFRFWDDARRCTCEGAEAYVALPSWFSFNIPVRLSFSSPNRTSGEAADTHKMARVTLSAEESAATNDIIRWLTSHADALDASEARAALIPTDRLISYTPSSKIDKPN